MLKDVSEVNSVTMGNRMSVFGRGLESRLMAGGAWELLMQKLADRLGAEGALKAGRRRLTRNWPVWLVLGGVSGICRRGGGKDGCNTIVKVNKRGGLAGLVGLRQGRWELCLLSSRRWWWLGEAR